MANKISLAKTSARLHLNDNQTPCQRLPAWLHITQPFDLTEELQ
jgi:hypothetical protein